MATSITSAHTEAANAPSERPWFESTLVRVPVLLALFVTAAGYEAVRTSALFDTDIWWHLRTGLWILQNHAVPRTGLFSQYSHLKWIDSSWAFQVLLAAPYKALGLRSIPILLMACRTGFAIVTFSLARGWRGKFWTAVALSGVAQYLAFVAEPIPVFFSILLFGIELILLLQCRRSGDARPLFWLPALFLVWANLHAEFVDGLLLLGLFLLALCAEDLLTRTGAEWSQGRPLLPLRTISLIAALSFVATLLTPYTIHTFGNWLNDVYSDAPFQYFDEFHAMNFRQTQHYVFVLLIMAAFLALGRRRSRDIFKLSLLVVGTAVAFRIQRDAWCAVLPAVAILADAVIGQETVRQPKVNRSSEKLLTAGLVLLAFVLLATRVPADRNRTMAAMSAKFPVKACDFIRDNNLPAPLFNPYAWGGFITWYLPSYPVAIDGRVGLYGSELATHHYNTVSGNVLLEDDPSFAGAGTILLEQNSGIARALTSIPRLKLQYQVLYRDEVGLVLTRR